MPNDLARDEYDGKTDKKGGGGFFNRIMGRGGAGSNTKNNTSAPGSPAPHVPPVSPPAMDDSGWPAGLQPGDGGLIREEDVTVAQLQQLERTLRDTLRDKRSVYESGKDMLARHFRDVDDGSGDVDIREFCAIWSRLGVEVTGAEATALFKKHGFAKGIIPYKRFMELLLKSPSRTLTEGTVKKGAFNLTGPFTHNGKIIYPQCRKGVYPPSNWTKQLGARSAELPDASLRLEFVYGYAGVHNTSSNLFYLNTGELVYYTAAVAVVYNRQKHTQRFFLGHVDDIRSLCVCPSEVSVAASSSQSSETSGSAVVGAGTGSKLRYEARRLVATGQIMTEDVDPYVSIWDSMKIGTNDHASAEVRRLSFPKEAHGICAIQFSPDARLLACVSMDVDHTLYVYDWRKNVCLFSGRSFKLEGTPPQVFGITWNPHAVPEKHGRKSQAGGPSAVSSDQAVSSDAAYEVKQDGYEFVTFGVKHIKAWRQTGSGAFKAFTMKFVKCNMQHVMSAVYLPPSERDGKSRILTGHPSGDVYVWRDDNALRSIAAHRPGPAKVLSDGTKTHHGVRLSLLRDGRTLVTSGGDGCLQVWDVNSGTLKEECRRGEPAAIAAPPRAGGGKVDAHAIRSFDVLEGTNVVAVGTHRCDIMELNVSSIGSSRTQGHGAVQHAGGVTTFIDGHEADLYSIEWHPTKPEVFATACESSRLFVFDAQRRVVMKTCKVGFLARACAWSSAPVSGSPSHHLAIGGKSGKVKVLAEDNLQPLFEFHDLRQPITDMKYSPDNKYLAVAGHDTYIDIYNVAKGYQKVARCSGHSATVKHIDWSSDSSIIQSNCASYEILYWDARNGKQIVDNQRDTDWASWTCALGFPVMGIFPDYSDGTDVNGVERSPDGNYVATVDDFGLVKLFNYPCVCEDSPAKGYSGHSSHVMSLGFSKQQRWMNTAGGKDRAVFQFVVQTNAMDGNASSSPYVTAHTVTGRAPAMAASSKPAAAEKVWADLDGDGKNFGWKTVSSDQRNK